MRLVKLEANRSSFHTIEFKNGINIIVGKQATPFSENDGNTYNGVGKSFVIHLIHFCLGSNKITSLGNQLKGWSYSLTFSVNDTLYKVTRFTESQNTINFCGEDIPLGEYRKELLKLCFELSETPKNMTWNTLFSRFARRYRSCYSDFDSFVPKESDYSKILNNGYLLGLNHSLIVDKKKLRDRQTATNDTEKAIKKDPVFKEYYLGENDTEIDIEELSYKIENLKDELSSFKISNNYHDLEKEANEKSYQKKKLENKRSLISMNIRNIKESLEKNITVDTERLLSTYNSAEIEIPDMVKKNINEVLDFHKEMLINRDTRLKKELLAQEEVILSIENKLLSLGAEMDQLLNYLNSHGALEEYLALSKQLSFLENEKSRVLDYKKILKKYKDNKLDIKSDYLNQDKKTDMYLEESDSYLSSLKKKFRNYAKEFYPKKASGLIIKNNFGENQVRLDIEARIEDDSSDGVNEVRIFCFDLLIFTSHVSNMNFFIHDSRLLANMDPRQREMLFRLMQKITFENKSQYICSVNEDTLQSIQPLMNDIEYKEIIEQNIILELNDDSPESKLLGIQVDIDLEGKPKSANYIN